MWLRWSWRDLRARWLQVAAIAFIIAIGTGIYAGLTSSSQWRRISYDESYAALNAHDLEVALATGTTAEADLLLSAIGTVPGVRRAEPRLILPTQVDASIGEQTILVPGELVGVDIGADPAIGGPGIAGPRIAGPQIDRLDTVRGRPLDADDAIDTRTPRVLLDEHFARHHELPDQGTILVSGGKSLNYVGTALAPEYFIIEGSNRTLLAEAGYAVIFAPIETVRALSGTTGTTGTPVTSGTTAKPTNNVVIELDASADPMSVAEAVRQRLGEMDGVAAEVSTLAEDRIHRYLYDDIDGDQRLFNIFAALLLGGAAFAAFNLVSRIVESQRREIGIGMAIGADRARLALRPLLFGLEISVLGTVAGVLVGLAVGSLIGDVNRDYFPLPVWRTPFAVGAFARGSALGIGLPFLATVWPVWRALRVPVVEALRPGGAAGLRGGLSPLARHLNFGGRSLRAMPLRNVLRAPRRTILTSLAVGTTIATLIAVIGMLDSFMSTIDVGEREVLQDAPNRLVVDLSTFTLDSAEPLLTLDRSPLLDQVEPGLQLPGRLGRGSREPFDVMVSVIPFDSEIWTPTTVAGSLRHEKPGVVLARKAADDLAAGVGDLVTLRHPVREGLTGYRWEESELPVLAIHPNPYRFTVYFDQRDAAFMNLEHVVNTVQVTPAAGVEVEAVQRALFVIPGVASAQPVAEFASAIRDVINDAIGVLDVVRAAVLFLALLIAFNTSVISADERAREHATMFAFGLPIGAVLRANIFESAVVGALGTGIGFVLGRSLLQVIVEVLLPSTVPDLAVTVDVAMSTWVTAGVLGTLAVAIAPAFTLRRLRRMNIPATLRLVE